MEKYYYEELFCKNPDCRWHEYVRVYKEGVYGTPEVCPECNGELEISGPIEIISKIKEK